MESMEESVQSDAVSDDESVDRRSLLSSAAMVLGLTSSYGMFGAIAGRYLYPARPAAKGWMYVAELAAFASGSSLTYRTPSGQTISVARLNDEEGEGAFIALSAICPHLGCKVHWEGNKSRFFCPCHNGAFDAEGVAIEGPPKDDQQTLARYPLKVEAGLLFIEVELIGLI